MLPWLIVIISVVIGGVILLFCLWYLSHFLSMTAGAPYMRSHGEHIEFARERIVGRERVADIGSGNGDILLVLARENAEVHGYELNPFLVWLSRKKIRRANLSHKAFVHWGNFWRHDFQAFDAIYVFCIPHVMLRLGEKLRKELPAGAIVVSAAFPLIGWPPTETRGNAFFYKKEGLNF